MKADKAKRIAAALGAAALTLSGCAGNSETALRESIIPDFEIIVETTDNIRVLYEEILDAAEEYAQNSNEETKTLFLEKQEENVKKISENMHVKSSLEDEERSAMSRCGISEEDYFSFFEMFASESQYYLDLEPLNVFVENGDTASLEATNFLDRERYVFDQRCLYYDIMDLFADTGDENIKYLRDMLDKYPTVVLSEAEWLTNRDGINQKLNEAEDELSEVIDEYKKFINGQENILLELMKKLETAGVTISE